MTVLCKHIANEHCVQQKTFPDTLTTYSVRDTCNWTTILHSNMDKRSKHGFHTRITLCSVVHVFTHLISTYLTFWMTELQWPQHAQHIYSTCKIQVTKNIHIIACWIKLGVNPLTSSVQKYNNPTSATQSIIKHHFYLWMCICKHTLETPLEVHFTYFGKKEITAF
jgi:hypothetical protein